MSADNAHVRYWVQTGLHKQCQSRHSPSSIHACQTKAKMLAGTNEAHSFMLAYTQKHNSAFLVSQMLDNAEKIL
eukprot:1141515-Pelagomonas_calceolata.AAC.15